jgi:phosphatidylserine/phosphatidylglycerophosphate/cardiolipin synthase-like enzyme
MNRLTQAICITLLAASLHADVFRILDDPGDAAQVRVDLMQQARRKIDAVYFLARNDHVTLTALALLRDARRRRVGPVRLIIDANFLHIPKAVLAHLLEEGVQIKVYHPLTLRHPTWIFRRMHEKVVIVDAERYITGGRNLAESYFELSKKMNYIDRDVYVEGPSAAEADRHFEALWDSRDVADLRVHVREGEKRRAAMLLDDTLDNLGCGGFVRLNTGNEWSTGEKDIADVHFLHDPLVDGDGPRVGVRLVDIIASAKRSIVIESPYLVPSKSLLELLERKVADGVSVLIVTNSLRSADGVLAQAAYLKYRRRVARAGIDVREYKGPDSLHAKSIIVDQRTVLVGSYNVDPRSHNLNTEVMCLANDEDVARRLLDLIEVHIRNAWRIDGDGRAPRGEHFPGRRAKSFRAWAARLLLLPVIEGQL